MSPGRLAHLKLEVAAADRRYKTFQPNVRNEDCRQLARRWRKMRNAGMRPENAMDPRWEWLAPGVFSR